jgi:hypothetical protein
MAQRHKVSARRTSTRARRSLKMPRIATSARATSLDRRTKNAALAGVALFAAGLAAAGATIMRARIGKFVRKPRLDVVLQRLLTQVGLREPPSLGKRVLLPAGIFAALAATAGSALFLFAPKLREAVDEEMSKDGVGPSFNKAIANGSTTMHDSIGNASAEVKEGLSHASH